MSLSDEQAVGQIRKSGVPYTRLQAAISYVVSVAPRKEIPGYGSSPWSCLPRERMAAMMESLRVGLEMGHEEFYTRLAEAWYELREQMRDEDDECEDDD